MNALEAQRELVANHLSGAFGLKAQEEDVRLVCEECSRHRVLVEEFIDWSYQQQAEYFSVFDFMEWLRARRNPARSLPDYPPPRARGRRAPRGK